MDEKVQALTNQLAQSQSRAFEMISKLTEEKDNAIAAATNLQNIVNQVVSTLGLESPKISDIFTELNRLIAMDKALADTTGDKSNE